MKRIFPLGLIALGILLSFVAFAELDSIKRDTLSPPENIPQKIAGLTLTSSKSGQEAIAEFTNMHGKQFPVGPGAVGVYGNGEVTLWVAIASSNSAAGEMVSDMQVKIGEGNSPFTPITEIQEGNRKVYVLDGMGQKHYYFQSKDRVIWLATQPQIADQAIQQILEVYP